MGNLFQSASLPELPGHDAVDGALSYTEFLCKGALSEGVTGIEVS